jgi:hypothetical protein
MNWLQSLGINTSGLREGVSESDIAAEETGLDVVLPLEYRDFFEEY